MNTGLFDKNGTPINIGDRTRLVLDDGEVREFDVCFKTVKRTVKSHPDFEEEYAKVGITGVVFSWEGYDLFPCVDENGVSDVEKMEVIKDMSKEIFELPVPIGGTVWEKEFSLRPYTVIGYRIGKMMSEDIEDYEEDYEDGVWYIQYSTCGIDCSAPVTEIGKSIFLTREEAMAAIQVN